MVFLISVLAFLMEGLGPSKMENFFMKMENSNQSISGHPKTEVSRVGHVELLRAENFCHFTCRHVHYSYHFW